MTLRTSSFLALGLALAFVVGGVGAALAQPPDDRPRGPRQDDADAADPDTNASARGEAARARVAELRAERAAILASFHENRSRVLEEYRAELRAIRESFLENKTAVVEACRAEHASTENASAADGAVGACVRADLVPLVEAARAEMRDARESARAELVALREDGMSQWAKSRAHADARHGKAAGDDAGADEGA